MCVCCLKGDRNFCTPRISLSTDCYNGADLRLAPPLPCPTQRRVSNNLDDVWQLTLNLRPGSLPATPSPIRSHEQEIKLKPIYCLVDYTIWSMCVLLIPLAFPPNLLVNAWGPHTSSYRKPCFCQYLILSAQTIKNCERVSPYFQINTLFQITHFSLFSNKQVMVTQFHGYRQKTWDFRGRD